MANRPLSLKLLCVLLLAGYLTSCGGGGGGSTASQTTATVTTPAATTTTTAPSSGPTPADALVGPQATGNSATDGLAWINFRRQQLGEPALLRTATIDTAALAHSNYQQRNNLITHTEVAGNPGFTGVSVGERLTAANYRFTASSYAFGEVISSTVDPSGFNAAEELITAIYHRFAIFEPEFRQAGAGAAASSSGRNYLTVDFTVDGLGAVLGKSNFVVYPADQQRGLPTVFFSDYESPDPVPDRNEVGYPVSVHADITSSIAVQSFTIKPRNGANLPTVLLQNATDPHTPASTAAIVPHDVLAPATTYDVQFSGTVDGTAVSRAWSFTTR
jgi:uncharacterized protein YkwD